MVVETSVEPSEERWHLRDWIAAAALFAATVGVVLWQNAHVAVLFDLSYILNAAERIAAGQVPYRDFPLAHAPLTFLVQAAIIRLTGRVYFHHVLYTAAVGGLGTVLTWRIAFGMLRARMAAAWIVALLVAAPLCVVGIYCILPTPEYDCDCGFWILAAVWFLLRVDSISHPKPACTTNEHHHPERGEPQMRLAKPKACPERRSRKRSKSNGDLRLPFGRPERAPHPRDASVFVARVGWRRLRGFAAGIALCVPLFFKQNMGLPFLLASIAAILFLLAARRFQRRKTQAKNPGPSALLAALAGAGWALLTGALALHFTSGIRNYLHWTIAYAGQRRLPGLGAMAGVYLYPALAWMLPCVVAGLVLLRYGKRTESGALRKDNRRSFDFVPPGRDFAQDDKPTLVAQQSKRSQIAAFLLLAAPFLYPLAALFFYYDDADSRGDSFLMIWPVLLVCAAALALANLVRFGREPSFRAFVPLILLAAIHGALMSQQLWGSTYGIWPLLVLLLAELLAFLGDFALRAGASRLLVPTLAAFVSAAMLVCGGFYTASEERLSYAYLPNCPLAHSAFPELAGLATPGPYLPEIDELLRYAQADIPFDDGIVLIPGEEPFYFATGRVPHFPVPFFDPTIDPYSPAEIVALVRSRNIRWLIVKTDVQTKEDPTPDRAATLDLLMSQFSLAAQLHGYNVYRR